MDSQDHNLHFVAERMFSGLDSGALIVNSDGIVVFANAKIATLCNCPRENLVGRALSSLIEREVLPAVSDEARLLRDNSDPLPILAPRGVFSASLDTPAHELFLVIDISAQKESEARQHDQLAEVSRLSDTVIEQAIALKRYAHDLEERVRERTADLREANLDAIFMLAVASEAKDADTGAHVLRIQEGCEEIALRLGMSPAEAEEIGYSSILHDVGKMVVPDHVLQKPGKLTADERKVIESHTLSGERILSTKAFFKTARQIARSHHENWNGTGYPDGLAGDAIPLAARIVHVADVFDALTNARVYKPAWSTDDALAFLNDESEGMFDPQVVKAFEDFLRESTP